MASPTLNKVLAELVTRRVEEALSPYMEALERLSALLGHGRRGPGRPRKAAWDRGPRSRQRRVSGAARGDASAFEVGQSVQYNQGRGTFGAKVIAVDRATNTLTLERTSDGKRIDRPASRVTAARAKAAQKAKRSPGKRPAKAETKPAEG